MPNVNEPKVRLFAPGLKHYESFDLTHAERILNYSDVWVLPESSKYEYKNYELKLKEDKRDTTKSDKKGGTE